MSETGSGIFAVECNGQAFVAVIGRGSYQNSQPLRELGQEWLRKGSCDLFIDLGQCQAMDSTFLGMLSGFALALQERAPQGRLHLVNVCERLLHSLQVLGVERVAEITSDEDESIRQKKPAIGDFKYLPGTNLAEKAQWIDKLAIAELMHDCHENLCRVDERNEARFKDVKRLLKEDIERHKATPPREG